MNYTLKYTGYEKSKYANYSHFLEAYDCLMFKNCTFPLFGMWATQRCNTNILTHAEKKRFVYMCVML